MDGARLSPYPHLSWLVTTIPLRAEAGPTGIHLRSVAHSVSMPLAGRHAVRWICRGRERSWVEHPGTVHFRPCNWEWQDFVIHSAESGDVAACFIPPAHLEAIADTEHLRAESEPRRALLPDDAVIRQALLTLVACRAGPLESCGRADEAARRLVLRLLAVSGGGVPDWHDDASVFDRQALASLIEHIDAHLKLPPSLTDMGMRAGLSPSHFARKFRQSTGLSLHRFVNRRRIQASLPLLQEHGQSLAGVALELGFSSQSHFTRIFSGLTGMPPAKYRKLFRRTTIGVGWGGGASSLADRLRQPWSLLWPQVTVLSVKRID